jgi:hypothetical protein
MIQTSVEKLAEPIGFDIGNSTDVVQADLLNGFCSALSSLNSNDKSMQLCYIARHLSTKSKNTLKELVEFIKLE